MQSDTENNNGSLDEHLRRYRRLAEPETLEVRLGDFGRQDVEREFLSYLSAVRSKDRDAVARSATRLAHIAGRILENLGALPQDIDHIAASLSQRQAQTFYFIRDYMEKYYHAPTYEDIQRGIQVSSKSAVHRVLNELTAAGLIERPVIGRRRSIRLCQQPGRT